ncbi:phage-related minor tail protein [Rhodococcus sp. SMB37]|uniref:hypothetical protein n=1 Tax=Rhodococcus sp. SMB37 TaxID=2512213 RepID=UPI0010485E3A|nr:hypothetical protein [Rhodococcus sp. SMB37]TCN51781.1 phage-related minor tail protein [Rhodococcus sp. SMB37]
MTAPSGSIGIGITIDAGDLSTEITQAVQSAMSGVLSTVRSSMTQVEGAISGIDTSGFNQVAQAAQQAAQQAQQAAQQSTNSMNQATQQVGDTATRAARSANTAMSRIDATAIQRIAAGADDAMDHLQQLDRWQLQALTQEVNRAGQNIGNEIGAGASQAERSLGQLDAASLERLLRQIRDVEQGVGEIDDETDQAASAFDRFGAAGDGLVGKLAGVAGGLVAIGGAMDIAMGAIEGKEMNNKLAAQLNMDPEEAAKAGRIAGGLFRDGYGESMEGVNDAIGGVVSSLGNMTDMSEQEIAGLTESALGLSKAFEVDVGQSAQTANMMIRNGLAKDGAEAFDLITAAMQGVPAMARDEIFPVMDEYATYFQSLGFDGTEAMGMIVNASQNGAIGMDKAGDALKEFGIRATDLGDTGAMEALEGMGFVASDMANALLAGGDTAQEAFQKIVGGLQGIEDPAAQAAAATALFGTPLEDLDKTKIPNFLAGLSNADSALGDVSGRAQEMGDTLQSGPGVALEKLTRQIKGELTDALLAVVGYFQENQDVAKILGGALLGLVGAYAAVRTASALNSIALGIQTAATGASTASIAANRLAMGAAAIASGVMRGAQLAGAAATGIATAAQWAFNAAISANPITLIVIAIAALVAGLVLFFTKTELGQQIWQGFVDFLSSSWETIKGAFQAAWDFISPILQSIWDFVSTFLVGAFNALVGVVTTVFDTIGAVISAVWNNVISPIFNFWHTMITGVLIPIIMFLWNSVIAPAFNGIGSIISTVWNTVINVIFTAFRAGMDAIGVAANWLWNNVIMPVWNGIASTISFVWTNLIMPVFDGIKAGMFAIGDAATWLWHNVITPVWTGIGDAIRWVIDNVIKPAWDGMKSALQSVGDFFGTVVGGIRTVWDGLRSILAKPINFMINTVYRDGIQKAWNAIAGFIPNLEPAPDIAPIPEHATGGPIRGPGTGTSDDVLMWGSNGEHMVTAKEVMRAGGHNVLYAIRDMIARGIPFEWDGGRVVSKVGENNMSRYGAAVQRQGFGNVNPEGLFDALLPGYKDGGAIVLEPWMLQLAEGHKFAQSQSGKPYQWAGPSGLGSSFDCSGYMASIAAAILGGNVWQRYWYTGSFGRGQGPGGPQGFVPGVDAGFSIGVTDDPGGPGGGHTAGVLGAVPGMFPVTRVESSGSGGVQYGAGPDVMSFLGQYHLPIGANGFFQPGIGGTVGPSPDEQRSFLVDKVHDVLTSITDPIKGLFASKVGTPPPEWYAVPPKFLDGGVDAITDGAAVVIDGLGGLLSSAWSSAKSIGGNVLDALNPFDSGGMARGIGFMPKNIIAPERVLSPEQTKLFEILVTSLQALSKGDYDGGLSRVGIEEDSAIVDAALTMQEVATSVDALVNKGDYDGTMARFGIEEDHGIVDAVLSVREVAASIDTLVRDGDYDGTMARFGIQEDHPVIDAVLDVRDAVVALDENAVKVATDTIEALGNSASKVAVDLIEALGPSPREKIEQVSPDLMNFLDDLREEFNEQGELISSTESQARRSQSSHAQVLAEQYRQLEDQVLDVSNRLSSGVLGPVVQTAMQSALGVVNKALVAATEDVTAAQGETTEAVKGIDTAGDDPEPPFGAPGSAFDLAAELSDMVVSVANTASDALMQVGMDIAKAALEQQKSEVDNPRGVLGDEDNSGGTLIDTIVRLTGVEIQIRDTIYAVAEDVKAFRGDQFQTFDETGQLLSDTASMLERSASSTDMVLAEQNRINRELMKSVMRYLMVNVLLPVLSALLTALITIAVTLVAAAIGAMIAGPIGLAIGAALGAVVGLALSAVAAGVIGSVGLGAAAAIDSFDEGGVANGIGIMPKNTIAPERVLSPRQTASFDRLVDLLDARGIGGGGNKSVHVGSVNVHGTQAAEKSADHLLSLLNS